MAEQVRDRFPAGRAVTAEDAGDAGFSRFRQVTQIPVNVVLEFRP
jgi:hypothetical protein